MFDSSIRAIKLFRGREFSLSHERCPLCGFPLQIRLRCEEMAIRCMRCGASAVTQSLVDVLLQAVGGKQIGDAYELSAAGPLVRWLRCYASSLTTSEFFPDTPIGAHRGRIVCQDVQRLTYANESFDLVTSTEVFEHVEDDAAGFQEIFRVLRPKGLHVFSIPLDRSRQTVERTVLREGGRINVYPPEYHADRFRGSTVFCFRNYGYDVIDRLKNAGFVDVCFVKPRQKLFGYARSIVVSRKL